MAEGGGGTGEGEGEEEAEEDGAGGGGAVFMFRSLVLDLVLENGILGAGFSRAPFGVPTMIKLVSCLYYQK